MVENFAKMLLRSAEVLHIAAHADLLLLNIYTDYIELSIV